MNGLTYFWCVRAACSWSTEFGFTLPGTSSISGHACFEALSSTLVIVNCSQLMATVGNHGQSITILSKQCSSRHFIEVSSLNSISQKLPCYHINGLKSIRKKTAATLIPKVPNHNKKNILHKKYKQTLYVSWHGLYFIKKSHRRPFIATPHSPSKLVLRQVITKLIRLLLSIPLLNPSATAVGWAAERFQAF